MKIKRLTLMAIISSFGALLAQEAKSTAADISSMDNNQLASQELKQDENLTIETLPNGFTIAVFPNAEPPKRVSMRLLVRRGSAVEKQGEEGLAHFIEHMAFNGTSNFPKGDMVEYFQRLGMAFGADTNAHTSFTETVYKIDIPSNEQKIIKDGLVLLSDYASGILFANEEIERERGVIVAEKKSRDTASYRASLGLIKMLFPNSVYAKRFPIGEESTILSAPRSAFVEFYKANYRPENMVLVVVGDVKTKAIIDGAKKYFSQIKGDENVAPRMPDSSKYAPKSTEPARAFHTADADMRNSSGSLYIVSALKFEKETAAKHIYYLRLNTIAKIIELRFGARKTAKNSGFTSVYSDFESFENYADIFSIAARANVGASGKAMEEVVKMYMGILSNGFGEWELEKVKNETLNALESNIRSKSTRKNVRLADEITALISEGEIISSPEDDLELAKIAFADFGAQDATAMFRTLVSEAQVYVQTRDVPSDKKSENIKFVLEKFMAGEGDIAFSSPLEVSEIKFAEFAKTGEIISESVDELGIRRLAFKNGIRANLKKTDFSKDEFLVNISFGGGRLDLPADKYAIGSLAMGFILGGTKAQTFDEISVAKADKNISMNFSSEGDAFAFMGYSTPKYMRETLALMATYIKEAAYRDEASGIISKMIDDKYRQLESNPDALLAKLDAWLCSDNFRMLIPEKEEVKRLTMADLKAWMEPIVKNSYMEISLAGDFDEDEAKELLKEFFGSLDERQKARADYSAAKKVEFTKEQSTEFYVKNVNDLRSYAVKIWPTCGRADIKKMRAANVLGAVVNESVRKIVRESSGKVYSPFANNASSPTFDYGAIFSISDVSPEFNGQVIKLLEESADSVSNGISKDEFERAKAPILKQIEKTKRMNSYWVNSVMPLIQAEELKYEIAKTFESGYRDVTLEEVKNAAAEYLKSKEGYTVKILPEAPAK